MDAIIREALVDFLVVTGCKNPEGMTDEELQNIGLLTALKVVRNVANENRPKRSSTWKQIQSLEKAVLEKVCTNAAWELLKAIIGILFS